jgi:hypothetical protein
MREIHEKQWVIIFRAFSVFRSSFSLPTPLLTGQP